jgi:hypothetical protein
VIAVQSTLPITMHLNSAYSLAHCLQAAASLHRTVYWDRLSGLPAAYIGARSMSR